MTIKKILIFVFFITLALPVKANVAYMNLDWWKNYNDEILNEHFLVPYADRFQEGEFRKRIQFMFGGELRTIKFLYKGLSIEAVLDRFPTAEVLNHDDKAMLPSTI